MTKTYLIYCGIMFPYGFYRQQNTKMPEGLDLYGHRLCISTCNGIIYMSPFGIIKIFNQMNRIDIKHNKRDKLKYPNTYEELLGTNYDIL